MNAWYDVSPSQARAGRPAYHARGEIKSYGFGVSAVWYFNKHWFATSDLAISQLTGCGGQPDHAQGDQWGV